MPDVLAAFQAMGDAAVPPLVEITFRSPRAEWLRRVHGWLRDQTPWLLDKLPSQFSHWFYSGQSIPFIAGAALGKLKPPAAILFPLVTNQLAATDWELQHSAMGLLTCVGDQREAAVRLLVPFVSAGDVYAIGLVGTFGESGSVAVPQLVECLSTNGDLARAATHSLGRIGPPASAALPALRKLFEQVSKPTDRLRVAISASNIQPQDWATAEVRAALTGGDHDLRMLALDYLGVATNAAARVVPELVELARLPQATPHVQSLALDALGKGTQDWLRIAPVLEGCLNSNDSAVRTVAAVHLLERDPTLIHAFACVTNAAADPLLWLWREYHPMTPEKIAECMARMGPRGESALTVLRERAKNVGREWAIDEAVNAAKTRR